MGKPQRRRYVLEERERKLLEDLEQHPPASLDEFARTLAAWFPECGQLPQGPPARCTSRQERVDLLAARAARGFALWNDGDHIRMADVPRRRRQPRRSAD